MSLVYIYVFLDFVDKPMKNVTLVLCSGAGGAGWGGLGPRKEAGVAKAGWGRGESMEVRGVGEGSAHGSAWKSPGRAHGSAWESFC